MAIIKEYRYMFVSNLETYPAHLMNAFWRNHNTFARPDTEHYGNLLVGEQFCTILKHGLSVFLDEQFQALVSFSFDPGPENLIPLHLQVMNSFFCRQALLLIRDNSYYKRLFLRHFIYTCAAFKLAFFSFTLPSSQSHHASNPSPFKLLTVKTSIVGFTSLASFVTASTENGT